MVTLTSIQAKQLRATFLAAAALLEEPVKVKKKRRTSADRYDEMYATGRVTKPQSLKKKVKSK